MSEAVREMTYEEQIANFIMNILAIEMPFDAKRDLIGHLLSLTYRHERDIKDALYTPAPCTFFGEKMGEGMRVGTDMTNPDRIRSMTDEELAEWINKHDCNTNLYGYDPKDAILDWLKEEVDDADN